MPDVPVDALVVLDAAEAGVDLHDVQVTQRLEPRVCVVRASMRRLDALAGAPGVRAVLRGDEPAPDGLDEREQLFVEAWRLSRRRKDRPGDGLAWDAAGFLPPDPPGVIPPSRT